MPPRYRAAVAGIVDGAAAWSGESRRGTVDQVTATVTGRAGVAGAAANRPGRAARGDLRRVLAKSDSAALGIHGIAVRRRAAAGHRRTFLEPQAPAARRSAMELIGAAITAARDDGALPIHLVVPDRATADLLVSAADSVAGVELSRMRWQRDLDMGRPR